MAPHLLAQLPRVVRLLPGVELHRRDAHHLQVGFGVRAVVVPDTAEVRHALETGDLAPDAPTSVLLTLTRLLDAGLVVDGEQLAGCLDRYADNPVSRAAVGASLCESPSEAAGRWARRSAATALVDAPPPDRAALSRILDAAGVRTSPWAGPGSALDPTTGRGPTMGRGPTTGRGPAPGPGAPVADGVVLLVRDREPDREDLDDLQRRDIPHLVVRSDLDHVEVGPFVVPGRTACIRCLDAHLADLDPRRPLVLEQHVRSPAPAPRDPALHHLALAWAARDLLRWWDGLEPSSWSATIRVGPSLVPQRREWLRHPHCGCGWADLPGRGDHQNSESSFPSIDRRCSREQVSQ